MFHKNAIFIHGAFLGFCGISFSLPLVLSMIPTEISSKWDWLSSQILLLSEIVIFFWLISVVFVIISSHFTSVKIGRPFVKSLTIAYQYGCSDTVSTSDIRISHELFPSNDKIQICYERKNGPFGLAHGIVINGQLVDETKMLLISHGYHIMKTKPVSHAIHISCPAVPWLSYFGQWLILTVIYPKLYKYSKTHKLSAYPVVELYQRFSITLMAPLSQQDMFVVPEAECLMHRSMRLVNVSDSSMTEGSLSASYHTTRAKLSDPNGEAILTPRQSRSPICLDISRKLSITPLNTSYMAKIILKHSLTPVTDGVVKPIVRTSTPIESDGHARGE